MEKNYRPKYCLFIRIGKVSATRMIPGPQLDYAQTTALSERNLVSHLLDQKKLSLIAVGRIARKLAQVHSDFPANDKTAHERGRADVLRSLCEDMLYQMKRHLDESFTQPIRDMIRHPLDKFLMSKIGFFSAELQNLIVEGMAHCCLSTSMLRADGNISEPSGSPEKICDSRCC